MVQKPVTLATARTMHIASNLAKPVERRSLAQLEDWWAELCGRPVDLKSVFHLASPQSTTLNTFHRGLQYRVAARAIVDGETRKQRGAECARCPRSGCDGVESLTHIFYHCSMVMVIWEWAGRVIERLIDVDICATPLPRGQAPLRVKIYFDGASRREQGQSRGPGGAGAFVVDSRSKKILFLGKLFMPNCTNNEAEHKAACMGLKAAVRLKAWEVELVGDSTLVLDQLSGNAEVNNAELKAISTESNVALSKITRASFTHVYRRFNKAADGVANSAADGCNFEWYTSQAGQGEDGQTATTISGKLPDIATCLLGIQRHRTKATLASRAVTDWFHHIRLSVLYHVWQTRNECWAKDLHATGSTIRKRVAKDIVHRALLESATGKAPFSPARVLRPGATFATATPQDFQDLTLW